MGYADAESCPFEKEKEQAKDKDKCKGSEKKETMMTMTMMTTKDSDAPDTVETTFVRLCSDSVQYDDCMPWDHPIVASSM